MEYFSTLIFRHLRTYFFLSLSSKLKLYANLSANVDKHNLVLEERDRVLISARKRLIQESGNVLGWGCCYFLNAWFPSWGFFALLAAASTWFLFDYGLIPCCLFCAISACCSPTVKKKLPCLSNSFFLCTCQSAAHLYYTVFRSPDLACSATSTSWSRIHLFVVPLCDSFGVRCFLMYSHIGRIFLEILFLAGPDAYPVMKNARPLPLV